MAMLTSFNDYWSTSVLSAVCCVTLALWWRSQKPRNAPPGPTGLPYIGSLMSFMKNATNGTIIEYMMELHRKYGPIVCVRVGVQRIIYINDGELIATTYQKLEFSSKPVKAFPAMLRISEGSPRGLALNIGESHKEMRKFALLSLRDFGVGKKSLGEMIQTEASILCQHLEKHSKSTKGIISDLEINMKYATINLIHHIIFGFRYEYEDEKWKDLVQKWHDFFHINILAFPENYLPILGKIKPLNRYLTASTNERHDKLNGELKAYIESQVEEHRSTYVEGEVRDFIDLYIKNETEEREYYNKDNIFAVIFDLFRGGSDTTANTLTWSVLYLVKYPHIQRQLRKEIDEVVGEGQLDIKDKEKLVRTRAFINEVHRYASIAAVVPPHTVEKPEVVEGYTLQPNDLIIGSLHAIHHDKDYWGDPYTFRIDRWIDEKGELIKHEGHFYPFSVGKRVCPGRQFASIQVMLVLVHCLQSFTFDKAEGYPELTDEWTQGFLRSPKSLIFKITSRQ